MAAPDATPGPAGSAPSIRARFRKVIEDFEAHVRLEKEFGATTLPATPALVAALANPLPPPRARPAAKPAARPPAQPAPAAPAGDLEPGLRAIAEAVAACTACPLHKTRSRTVPGQGNGRPDILFVGEGPGAEEDRQGLAFVGAAGQLLTKMIVAMGYTREDVFIANIVKCRPPGNRAPEPAEARACIHFLEEQVALLRPKVIVSLGAVAVKYLMGLEIAAITRMRGNWLEYRGIPLMPTFHPAYLLRNPACKREAWSDLKAVLTRLGRQPPPRV